MKTREIITIVGLSLAFFLGLVFFAQELDKHREALWIFGILAWIGAGIIFVKLKLSADQSRRSQESIKAEQKAATQKRIKEANERLEKVKKLRNSDEFWQII